MLDLGTQLRDYLDATAPAVELEDIPTKPAGDSQVRALRPRRSSRPVQAWVSAAAAAIVVLLLVGGAAWLLRTDSSEEPAIATTVVPTTVTPTTLSPPTTSTPPDAVIGSTVAPTTTTGALPPGNGPKLEFRRIEALEGIATSSVVMGVWFDGALYSLEGGGTLLRSGDGSTWEPVPAFDFPDDSTSRLLTDGERLVAYVIPDDCPSGIRVNVSSDGSTWVQSEIELPVCSQWVFEGQSAAVGAKGIVISAVLYAAADGRGEGYAWFSEDGVDWLALDSAELLEGTGSIAAVAATSDGFVATVTGDLTPFPVLAEGWLWESADGITWSRRIQLDQPGLSVVPHQSRTLRVWNSMLVLSGPGLGVWEVTDEPRELIPAEATDQLSVMAIGPLGLVAIGHEMDNKRADILFSADGTEWNRWTVEEFSADSAALDHVGIGDDFVALWFHNEDGGSLWIGSLP